MRWSFRVLVALLALLGGAGMLLVALVLAPRLQPASAADRAARAALALGAPAPARANAFAALRGLDAMRWPDLRATLRATSTTPAAPALCTVQQQDCLAQVQRNPAAASAALHALVTPLAVVYALPADAMYWAPPPPKSATAPLATLMATGFDMAGPLQRALLTRAALSFVEGHHAAALAQACSVAQRWRALRRGSNDAVVDASGLSFSAQALQLMTQMAARLPANTPLPAPCAAAMAPLSDAGLALCPVASREVAWQNQAMFDIQHKADTLRRRDHPGAVLVSAMLIDARSTARGIERAYAWACAPDLPQRLRAGHFAAPRLPASAARGPQCIGNIVGCANLHALVQRAPLRANIQRRETFLAQQATLRQWLWLRAHAPDRTPTWPDVYAHMPTSLTLPLDRPRLDGNVLVLHTPQAAQPQWRLPLPKITVAQRPAPR